MTEIELNELGYYKPGFLHLNINTNLSLENLNDLLVTNKEVFSTFLHEYIHYLQNLTTTNGLYTSVHYIQFLKDIVWNIKESESTFKVPLEINNKFNRISQNKLHKVYAGDVKNFTNRIYYKDYFFEEQLIELIDYTKIYPKKYYVNYLEIGNNSHKKYHFGSYAIKEFIAHSIQNKFIETDHPDIPYLIADLIITKEIPKLSNNIDLKIILCDATLMSLHPAQTFFNTIERLKKEKNIPAEPKEMYEFVYKNVHFESQFGKFNNINELFEKFYNDAVYDYSDALKSEIFFNELNWLKHILKEARELRLNNPTFILDLVKNQSVTEEFSKITKKLGTPFFTNNQGFGGFILPNELKEIPNQTYLLAVVVEIINVIFGQVGCKMYKFCNNELTKNITSDDCLTKPWKKITDKELCPFCQLWKTWGIYNKMPEPRSRGFVIREK